MKFKLVLDGLSQRNYIKVFSERRYYYPGPQIIKKKILFDYNDQTYGNSSPLVGSIINKAQKQQSQIIKHLSVLCQEIYIFLILEITAENW